MVVCRSGVLITPQQLVFANFSWDFTTPGEGIGLMSPGNFGRR
jgi:hypothetical protein